MKLLQVIVGLNVGGAELMLKRLVESHAGSRYRHSVVSLTGLGTIGADLRRQGIEVTTLDMGSPRQLPRVIWQLAGLIRRERPDVVQTWMYHADLIGGIAARLAGNGRVVWGVRTTDVSVGNKRSTGAVMRACARLSGWVPHTIVCAAHASRLAHESVGYAAGKMTVVPNGFDPARLVASDEQRAALRAQCGFADGDVVMGTLGRFNPAKDHANFVRAAGQLAARHPRLRFLMVGRDLEASNVQLREWIAATGHADRFVLLGERSDVPVCLSAMDIFCLSSRSEGFPNVVGEAMTMAVPCVATDVGDAAVLVGDAGVVVPPCDPARLAAGVESILGMAPAQRAALGQKAADRIRAEFTMERSRERFEAIYQRIAGKGGY